MSEESYEQLIACIQTCADGHKYYAQSPEYPCPRCQIFRLLGALSDIRTLVTGCVPRNVVGRYKDTCKAVLTRTLDVEYQRPTWFVHSWEKELYDKYPTESPKPQENK